jgi:hypothetical protein
MMVRMARCDCWPLERSVANDSEDGKPNSHDSGDGDTRELVAQDRGIGTRRDVDPDRRRACGESVPP